ncbi:MAG: hypothetical protein Kow0073_05410 [Immundisolibacter sp.]
MDFAYTADQTALAGELALLFARFPAPPKLRAWADAGMAAFDGELWQALSDQRLAAFRARARHRAYELPGADCGLPGR